MAQPNQLVSKRKIPGFCKIQITGKNIMNLKINQQKLFRKNKSRERIGK